MLPIIILLIGTASMDRTYPDAFDKFVQPEVAACEVDEMPDSPTDCSKGINEANQEECSN